MNTVTKAVFMVTIQLEVLVLSAAYARNCSARGRASTGTAEAGSAAVTRDNGGPPSDDGSDARTAIPSKIGYLPRMRALT